MTPNLKVTISAVDKASETIKRINKSFSDLGKGSGIGRLDKLSEQLGAAAERLGALGRAGGGAAGLGGIGSIAGLAELARRWAEAGNAMSQASGKIGVSNGALARFQGASRLAGVPDDVATQAAFAMAKNIGDALSGRDGGTMFSRFRQFAEFGMVPRYKPDGTPDVDGNFKALQKALLAQKTAQGKNALLEAFNIPIEMRPVLEDWARLNAEVERLRPNADAAAAAGTELNGKLTRLGENLRGVGDNAELATKGGLGRLIDLLNYAAAAWNNAGKSGTGQKITTIIEGAAGGALTGAATGAAIGGVAGAMAGGVGAGPGAAAGALVGGVRGAVIGGAGAAGIELLGGLPTGDTKSPLEMSYPRVRQLEGLGMNNPGNLRTLDGKGFQKFETPAEGLVANAKQLVRDYQVHGLRTIGALISDPKWGWAPAAGGNNVGAYIRDVSDTTGILPGGTLDESQFPDVLGAIVKHEKGKQPFTKEELSAAVAAALKEAGVGNGQVNINVSAPAGTKVTAGGAGNMEGWPARIDYSLPNGRAFP